MLDDLVEQPVYLPTAPLRLLQPREAAELPDAGGVEWAPIAPYWSVLWRSGVALAREIDIADLGGLRVIELGCGLGAPSLAAARAGAEVMATDASAEAVELVARNAKRNGLSVATAVLDWTELEPAATGSLPSFDLAIAADVLYDRRSVEPLLAMLSLLAPEAWLAEPHRAYEREFLDRAAANWSVSTQDGDPVTIHRMSRDR